MKKVLSGILLISILSSTFYSVGIYVWFKANQTSIAKNLCRYKEEANNSCQGCCVLQKKLSETTSETNKMAIPNQNDEKPFVLYFFKLASLSDNNSFSASLKNNNFYILHFQSYEIINSLFRPPKLY